MPHPRTATVLPSPQSAPAWAAASTPRAPPDTTSTEARASPSARALAIRRPRSSLSRDLTTAARSPREPEFVAVALSDDRDPLRLRHELSPDVQQRGCIRGSSEESRISL